MSSVNRVTLVGNLGQPPEIRRTNNGKPVANLRIATSEKWTDKHSGEKKENTEWHNVVVFGPLVEAAIEKYFKKGSKVYVDGRLQTRMWETQAGEKRYSTEVVVQGLKSDIFLIDPSPAAAARSLVGSRRDVDMSKPGSDVDNFTEEMEDEIPF